MISEKSIKFLVALLSTMVLVVVIILNRKIIEPPAHIPSFVYYLPGLNALLNSISFFLLLFSLFFIKRKNIHWHQQLNLWAFFLSALFLISYVIAHYFLPETLYGDANHNGILEPQELERVSFSRKIYLFILLTHIILAAVTFPLVLMAFYFGLNKKTDKHRKVVRWAYPLWLYVCFTGPIVYVFLRPYYGF